MPETTETPPAETIEAKPAEAAEVETGAGATANTGAESTGATEEEQYDIAQTQVFEQPGKEWLTRSAAVKNGDTLLPALPKLDTDHLNRISEFCKTFTSTVRQHAGHRVPTKHTTTPFTSVGQSDSDDEQTVKNNNRDLVAPEPQP